MFSGLRRRAGLAVGLAASVVGLTLAAAAAGAAAAEAAPSADFLTVSSTPAGGFENLAPGDTAGWFVTARNRAAVDADLSLRLSSGSTSPLLTDAAEGLRLKLTACSAAWSDAATEPSCPGVTTAIAQGPLASLLGGYTLPELPAGSTAHYLARVSVPVEATNAVAGQAADLSFEITAVQGGPGAEERAAQPASGSEPAPSRADGGSAADPTASQAAAGLAGTGVSAASVCRSLALALLAAGSLVLVLRRIGAN